MPLLHKKPFVPLGIPEGLGKNDTVFFCKLTKEMFTDYDEFCERIILCNSLVWSCSLTGRSNLTFQEASNSEDRCKRLLKKFPVELRVPVLYLASLCERRSLLDLTEDVFCFVKDRFFIGETVQISLPDNPEANCKILSVIPPTKEELANCPKSDHDQNGERQYWPPGSKFKYEIEMEEGGAQSSVTGDHLFRKKSLYNKDKNRLYIKQFVHLSGNYWKLKNIYNEKYGISEVKFSDVFCGEPPVLSPVKPIPPKKVTKNGKQRQETLNKYFKPSPEKRYNVSPKKSASPKKNDGSASKLNNNLKQQKRKRRSKAEMLAAKELKVEDQEAKMKAKLERKEEKLKQAKFIKEWARKREDLECENLRELPSPLPVISRVPQEYFGDAIMVMEFLHTFSKLLPVKDFFPYGVTLEVVERALVDDEIAGPFADLIQLLLVSVMDLLDQENDEVKDTDVKITPNLVLEKGGSDTQAILRQATKALVHARHAHAGQSLGNLTLDSSTLTEVLRLHLLTSGSKANDKINKWRYQARGGYCTYDDPAVQLKLCDPHIMHQLSYVSVCELSIGDKIKIVNCLVNQVLTYSTLRDTIEDAYQKGKQARLELRSITALEQKTEKELKKKAKEAEAAEGVNGENGDVETPAPEPEVNRVLRGQTSLENNSKTKQGLTSTLNAAMALAHHTPLGEDRAYRKYWTFASLPGLYVEHYELNPGPCLPKGTPVWSGMELKDDNVEALIKLFESYGPNKENVSGLLSYPYSANNHFSPSKKLLTENNGVHPVTPPVSGDVKSECSKLTCWGDVTVCPVHGTSSDTTGPRWYFFKDRADIEALIERLNRRGIREKNLLTALSNRKEAIIESLEQMPIEFLMKKEENDEGDDENILSKVARQYENANMSFPLGTPHDSILESLLREQILETELKISAGGLGYLKVKNRDAWKIAIESHSYDKQCKKLSWGVRANTKENGKKDDASSEDGSRKDESDSRCSTPVEDMDEDGEKPKPQVLDLASAILQIEQCIDQKFLKRPLGLDQKERDKGVLKMPTPALEQWEIALMQSTSFSQLFLHFSTLDNSILWARSALNAFCRICRRKNNPENMLLCDTCNKGHHLYCLKPKLTKIPSGDWHCNSCRPKVSKVSSPVKKKRRVFKEEESESESDEDSDDNEQSEEEDKECSTCNEVGAELECGTCEALYHLACHNPPIRKVPKSKWFCQNCRQAGSTLNNHQVANNQPYSPKPNQPKKSLASTPSTPRMDSDERLSGSEECEYEDDEEEDEDFAGFGEAEVQASERKRKARSFEAHVDISASTERTSRRKCSKAASERIHKFAKQLRSTAIDQNDEDEVEEKASRGSARRRAARREIQDSDLPLDNAALQEILETVMHQSDAWPFLRRVTRAEVPDYHLVIKKPMDFGTIKHKLNMLEYTHNSELIADADLLFRNCYEYNEKGSEVYRAGESLEKLFNKLLEEHNLVRDLPDDGNSVKKTRLF